MSAVPVHTGERLLFTPIKNAALKYKLYRVHTSQSVQAK